MNAKTIYTLALALIISLPSLAIGKQQHKPLLVVLLMVKNEKEFVVPTLETYISKTIRDGEPDNEEVAYVLYDTGSTDGTEVKAQEFFEQKGIKNYTVTREVAEKPFDFAAYRYKGLAIAREKYPDSTFIIFPDAEWYLQNFDGLITWCKDEIAKYNQGQQPPPYYRIRMARTDYTSLTPRLILTHDDVCFEGARHEVTTKCSGHTIPETICIKLGVSREGQAKSKERWPEDCETFLLKLLENPKDVRSLLYLGLTKKWLGMENKDGRLAYYRDSYTYLKKRIEMHTFPQEDYYAMYNLAEVTVALTELDPKNFTWEEAFKYFLAAYNMRPHRAEPLVKIASHYLKEDKHGLSYLFARRATELPYPSIEAEILPIIPAIYKFDRWEILSRAAWYVKEYEIGEEAAQKAIEAQPNSPHLYRNLSFYWDRKK